MLEAIYSPSFVFPCFNAIFNSADRSSCTKFKNHPHFRRYENSQYLAIQQLSNNEKIAIDEEPNDIVV